MITRRYHYLAYRYYLWRCLHCRIRNPWIRRDRCALWLLKALVHHNLSLAPSMKYLSEAIGKAWGHQPGDSA